MTRFVEPGTIITPDQVGAIVALHADLWALSPDRVIVSKYSFPVLPAPDLDAPGVSWWPTPSGGPRPIPAGTDPQVWGHPQFWLDPAVSLPTPGETPDHWVVRIYHELLNRDLLAELHDTDDGDTHPAPQCRIGWIDALDEQGIDVVDDHHSQQRVARWINGETDPTLDVVTVATIPLETNGSPEVLAREFLTGVEPAYDRFLTTYRQWIDDAADTATAQFPTALTSLETATDAFISAGLTPFWTAQSHDLDHRTGWEPVVDGYDQLADAHDTLADLWAPIARRLLTTSAEPDHWWAEFVDLDALQARDNAGIAAGRGLIDQIREHPTEPSGFSAATDWANGVLNEWRSRVDHATGDADASVSGP